MNSNVEYWEIIIAAKLFHLSFFFKSLTNSYIFWNNSQNWNHILLMDRKACQLMPIITNVGAPALIYN